MLLSQIEGFVEVVRQGRLGRAAEVLFVSQPALTARIQALEAELAAPLFRRTRGGMLLTEAGRAFLPYAERALAAIDGGAALVGQLERGVAGELTLGAAPAVSTYVLPELLTRFTEAHPDVRLLVRTGHSEEIMELVARGDVQLGLVRELRDPHDARLITRPLYADELVLVVPPDHPFASAASVDIGRMAEVRLVLFDRTSSYYELINALFRGAGVAPRGVVELDNIEAAKKMVGHGLGVALLPATAVARELGAGELRRVELEGAKAIRRRIVLVERRAVGPPPSPVTAFRELLAAIPQLVPGAMPVGRRRSGSR